MIRYWVLTIVLVFVLVPAVAAAQSASESLQDAPTPENSCKADGNGKTTADSLDGRQTPFCAAHVGSASTTPRGIASSAKGAVKAAPWQGTLVTGLGEMLADRAKAEVKAWFDDLVRQKLCDAKAGLDQWFPQTCRLAKDKNGAGQQLTSSMVADAVRGDLFGLMKVVAEYLKSRPKAQAAVATLTVVPQIVAAAFDLADRRSPLLWVRDLSFRASVREACKARSVSTELTPACALVFAGLAVHYYGSVINLPRPNGLLDAEALKKLIKDVLDAEAFHCQVIQAMSNGRCTDPAPGIPAEINSFFVAIGQVDQTKLNLLIEVFQDMIDINDLVAQADRDPNRPRTKELLAKLDGLLGHVEKLLWAAPPREAEALRRFLQVALSLSSRDYAAAVRGLVEIVSSYDEALPDWAGRFLPLVVDLAEAEDSAQVAAALERAAAPVGSWRLKRQKPLWSITALVGGSIGYERPTDEDAMGGASLKGGWAAGLIAPVGLQRTYDVAGWSIGGMFSLLDVGQITWTRLESQEQSGDEAGAEQSPDADFAKVFSPGLYLTIGAADTPLTFGIGGSFAPALRSYTYELDGTERSRDVSVWRFGLYFAADVTLLPF